MKKALHVRSGRMLPVPWIIRWTAEDQPDTWEIVPFHTPWGTYLRRQETTGQYEGEPEWAVVSSERSFRSAHEGLCQVCGKPGADYWRLADGATLDTMRSSAVTETGTCLMCVAMAMRLCPNVRNHPVPWVRCNYIGIVGGPFGPPFDTLGVEILLPTGQRPPTGWVLKQPYILVDPIEILDPMFLPDISHSLEAHATRP